MHITIAVGGPFESIVGLLTLTTAVGGPFESIVGLLTLTTAVWGPFESIVLTHHNCCWGLFESKDFYIIVTDGGHF